MAKLVLCLLPIYWCNVDSSNSNLLLFWYYLYCNYSPGFNKATALDNPAQNSPWFLVAP